MRPKTVNFRLLDGSHIIQKDHRPAHQVGQIWVIDRFNQDEWMDFGKEDLLDVQKNSQAYVSDNVAKQSVEKEIRQGHEEAKTDDPEYYEEENLATWAPKWEKQENGEWVLSNDPDGSIWTVRNVALHDGVF